MAAWESQNNCWDQLPGVLKQNFIRLGVEYAMCWAFRLDPPPSAEPDEQQSAFITALNRFGDTFDLLADRCSRPRVTKEACRALRHQALEAWNRIYDRAGRRSPPLLMEADQWPKSLGLTIWIPSWGDRKNVLTHQMDALWDACVQLVGLDDSRKRELEVGAVFSLWWMLHKDAPDEGPPRALPELFELTAAKFKAAGFVLPKNELTYSLLKLLSEAPSIAERTESPVGSQCAGKAVPTGEPNTSGAGPKKRAKGKSPKELIPLAWQHIKDTPHIGQRPLADILECSVGTAKKVLTYYEGLKLWSPAPPARKIAATDAVMKSVTAEGDTRPSSRRQRRDDS